MCSVQCTCDTELIIPKSRDEHIGCVLFVLTISQLGAVTIYVDSSSMHSSLSSSLPTPICLFLTLMSMHFLARHVLLFICLVDPFHVMSYLHAAHTT